MAKVSVGAAGLTVGGEPIFVQAGVLHYFRLPHPDLWRSALTRMRMAGLNTVVLPVPWNYHSPAPGFVDFTGPRDLTRLLDDTEDVGLWLVVDVGPWLGLGLDSGGLPSWLVSSDPDTPDCVRQTTEWWDHLFPLFIGRPNLLGISPNPGQASGAIDLKSRPDSLVALCAAKAPSVPVVLPWDVWTAHGPSAMRELPGGVLVWAPFEASGSGGAANCGSDVPLLHLLPASASGVPVATPSRRIGHAIVGADYIGDMARARAMGAQGYALGPAHEGVGWGWWGAAGGTSQQGGGAPLGTLALPGGEYHSTRQMAMTLETARSERSAPEETQAHPSQGVDALDRGQIAWQVAGVEMALTSMSTVMRTTVAGRELVVLANGDGGEVALSDGLRIRHHRGSVRVVGADRGFVLRFGPGRLASVVVDLPGDRALQLLALDRRLAARVWPLDDAWRSAPVPRAVWTPSDEEPARGVVVGPDLVVPEPDGAFRLLSDKKGFGYRWGPWRGSDPNTWLAPFTWSQPASLTLPDLTWSAHPGSPEASSVYDDGNWRTVGPNTSLTMESLGIGYGFTWYRGHFEGHASSVALACHHACDVFLNGYHVASLNPPPDWGAVVPKTLPLPRRHMRERNVLAMLVENQGRDQVGSSPPEPHGVVNCQLDATAFTRWCVRAGLVGERSLQGFSGFADWSLMGDHHSGELEGSSAVTWHRSLFELPLPPGTEAPVHLRLDQTPGRNFIYLNGHLIGRMCYPQGVQRRFWLPDGLLLRQGRNELLIAQWTRGATPGIGLAALEAGPVATWHRVAVT